jgi:hypothetical protein
MMGSASLFLFLTALAASPPHQAMSGFGRVNKRHLLAMLTGRSRGIKISVIRLGTEEPTVSAFHHEPLQMEVTKMAANPGRLL